jgi:hypothetical protein
MPDIRLLMTADAAGGIWTYALGMKQALSARADRYSQWKVGA